MSDRENEILHQAWLKAACELFRQNFFYFPEVVATYGFPAPNSSDGFRGACHFPEEGGKDRRPVIIIHPAEWDKPIEVLSVLLHECIHAKFDKKDGHGERFITQARAIGLLQNDEGVWDKRSVDLESRLNEALTLLPEMPKDPLGRGQVKRQKGRMLLYICNCGWKIRCGRNELLATCGRCHTEFKLQE